MRKIMTLGSMVALLLVCKVGFADVYTCPPGDVIKENKRSVLEYPKGSGILYYPPIAYDVVLPQTYEFKSASIIQNKAGNGIECKYNEGEQSLSTMPEKFQVKPLNGANWLAENRQITKCDQSKKNCGIGDLVRDALSNRVMMTCTHSLQGCSFEIQ